MPEADWLRCVEPQAMLSEIAPRLSDRQLRLFAVACCRRVWHLLPHAASRHALSVAERYADGLANDWELFEGTLNDGPLDTASDQARAAATASAERLADSAASVAAFHAGRAALFSEHPWSGLAQVREKTIQCSLLRDIAGNPFAPVEFAPHWRTRDVLAVAQRIYAERDFAALPILVDALTDAGCEDSAILNHCEQPHHARGCWLLDQIQGMK